MDVDRERTENQGLTLGPEEILGSAKYEVKNNDLLSYTRYK